MKPQLKILDTAEGVEELREYLKDFSYVAYDTETTGLSKRDEIIGYSICCEEGVAYYVILAKWDKEQGKLVYLGTKESSKSLIEDLLQKDIICHNGTFDCYMTEAFFKVNIIGSLHTDTMVLAHLLNENRKIGLKELATEYFGEDAAKEAVEMKASVAANGGSLTKTNYEMYKADSHLLAKYGAKDAWLTYKLFLELLPELYSQELDKFFYEEESMPLLRGPTYELNTTGLQVDTKRLAALKKQLEAECLEAKAYIYAEIDPIIKSKYPGTNKKNTFNIGSSSQLAWLIFGQMSLEFNTLTDAGKAVCKSLGLRLPYTYKAKKDFIELCLQAKDSVYAPEAKTLNKTIKAKKVKDPWSYIACDKSALKKHAEKHKWIGKLLEYQRKMKILNTYIEGIEERIQYGVIHPSFLQSGTTSGRYASRNPNLQNLPRDDQRIKECFVARSGKVFVAADYSQLEPRVFSYYSQDPRLMAAFDGTSDFYSVVGMSVYNKTDCVPLKEGPPNAFGTKYKRLRDLSKVIALASAYGATAHQLAPTTGKSIDDTQQDMDNYFEEFPGVRKMMLDAHKLAKENGYVTNLFGRPRRIPDAKKIEKLFGPMAHAELPYEARGLLNLAVNHRIQSTGASICNRAAIKFYNDTRAAGIDSRIVLQVHDELVVECFEVDSEDVAMLLQNAMETAVILKGIDLEAVPRITKNLAK
jgi:DNA polymerase I